ncbi:MAG: hypothetical protein R3C49_22655 [Planctomycetaceae bacterium]
MPETVAEVGSAAFVESDDPQLRAAIPLAARSSLKDRELFAVELEERVMLPQPAVVVRGEAAASQDAFSDDVNWLDVI